MFCRNHQRSKYANLDVGFHEVWSVLTRSSFYPTGRLRNRVRDVCLVFWPAPAPGRR
jgi:hypothetical protein